MAGFAGFPAEALTFLRGLKKNNSKEWFEPRKEVYESQVKEPMAALVTVLNADLEGLAPDYVTDPKKAIYRIYRDTRFSKDKTPYKTHIAAIFPHRALGKHAGAGLYFAVSPASVDVGGGLYMAGPEEILRTRTHLAERHEEFRRLAGAKPFRALFGELHGEQLARIPKGFPAAHPAEDLLRRKQWFWYTSLAAELATTPALYREVKQRFTAMIPLLEFLNAPLLAGKKQADTRARFDRAY